MLVAALIGILISIVVGVSLIPAIVGTVNTVDSNPETPEGVRALMEVLPIVFVAVVILGAVAWIGGLFGGEGEKAASEPGTGFLGLVESGRRLLQGSKNPKYVYKWAEKASLVAGGGQMPDLEKELGFKVIQPNKDDVIVDIPGYSPLSLDFSQNSDGLLIIRGKGWDWYAVEKHPELNVYKLVGLHQLDRDLNTVYLIGENGKPVFQKFQLRYIKESVVTMVEDLGI